MQEEIGMVSHSGFDILWKLESNPDLDFFERCRRRLILQEVATALRLPMSRNTPELNQLIDSLVLHRQALKEFFENKRSIASWPDNYNILGNDPLLMPPEIQELVADQLRQHPEYLGKIMNLHADINDDIKFDNVEYQRLKSLLLDFE
jgi:hypothetical protein